MSNPFDFANPVTERALFAGRARELADIEYYIGLATQQKGVGIAIVGDRTSGKSSLLNMASSAALRLGFVSVRVDLSQDSADSEEAFLRHVYESMFIAAKKRGMWGDTTSLVYDAFRRVMDIGEGEKLREYLPLVFPQVRLNAQKARVPFPGLPTQVLIEDFSAIIGSAMAPRPTGMALLIDEGDHLAKNGAILQKLRVLMSNVPGLVVVIAGTEDMLESMDAVFAPIVRQFKRIRLTPFISPAETRQCLYARLRQVGNEGLLTFDTYLNLHQIASGQPFEAQLIAHHAYRRYLQNPTAGFAVTVSVLNDVLAEVERFRKGEKDRFAVTLRKYSADELRQLSEIVLYPRLSVYEKAIIDVAMAREGRVKDAVKERRQRLKEQAQRFVNDKVVSFDSETKGYKLNGDRFDALYAKLLAKSHRVLWAVESRQMKEIAEELVPEAMGAVCQCRPYVRFVAEEVAIEPSENEEPTDEFVFTETRFHEVLDAISRAVRSIGFRGQVAKMRTSITSGETLVADLWTPTVLTEIGIGASHWGGRGSAPTAIVEMRHTKDGTVSRFWRQPAREVDVDLWQSQMEDFAAGYGPSLEMLEWRIERVEFVEEPVTDVEGVLRSARAMGWSAVAEEVLDAVGTSTIATYLEGDRPRAERLAAIGLEFADGPARPFHKNNVGYIALASGKVDEARRTFEELCEGTPPPGDISLFNRAIARALMGDVDTAVRDLEDLQRVLETERLEMSESMVLFVPTGMKGTAVECEEFPGLPLDQAIRQALQALRGEV